MSHPYDPTRGHPDKPPVLRWTWGLATALSWALGTWIILHCLHNGPTGLRPTAAGWLGPSMAIGAPSDAATLRSLDEGRSRFDAPSNRSWTFHLAFPPQETEAPLYLVYRRNDVGPSLRIHVDGRPGTTGDLVLEASSTTPAARRTTPLPAPYAPGFLNFHYQPPEHPDSSAPPIVMDEFMVTHDPRALLPGSAPLITRLLDSTATPVLLFLLECLAMAVVLLRKAPAPSRGAFLAFLLGHALLFSSLGLWQRYPSRGGGDFAEWFTSDTLKTSSNLTYGLVMGSHVLMGHGPTGFQAVDAESGRLQYRVNPYRMPGYGFITALAGLGMHDPSDLLEMAERTVYLHLFLWYAALAFFLWTAWRVLPFRGLLLGGALAGWFPQAFDYTQSDTVVPAFGLTAVALCLRALPPYQPPGQAPGWVRSLWIHLAFAACAAIRSDFLIGWFAVGLFLHGRDPKKLVLPAVLILGLGSCWGHFRATHGDTFGFTTTNQGHVAFVGLWQVPDHRFKWEPKDASYDAWIQSHGFRYMTPEANRFAWAEVRRFWATFPVYTATMFIHKFVGFFRQRMWPGHFRSPPLMAIGKILREGGAWILFSAMLAAYLRGYRRKETFLLGWPLVFNMPIFCLLQESGGRFSPFDSICLLFAGAWLLSEKGYYGTVFGGIRRGWTLLLLGAGLFALVPIADRWVMRHDDWRYAAPFLDPAKSTLNVPKESSAPGGPDGSPPGKATSRRNNTAR